MDDRKYFIDGMRGWAALIVVFHHILYILKSIEPAYKSSFLMFLSDGQLAIRVFFILSGFALSTGYLHHRDPKILAALAIRRYPRLALPILLSTILITSVLASGLTWHKEAAVITHNEWWLGTFYKLEPDFMSMLCYALYDVYFKYNSSPPYNMVLWTMPAEFFGSLLIFLTLFVAHFVRRRFYIYIPVFFILLMQSNWILTFMFGLMLAELYETKKLQEFRQTRLALVAGLCIMAVGVSISTFAQSVYKQPMGFDFVALFIVTGPVVSARIAASFENRVSRFLGRISFPIYLMHQIILASLFSYLIIYLTDNGAHYSIAVGNILILVGLSASVLVAVLFEPVERFSIRLSHKFSDALMR